MANILPILFFKCFKGKALMVGITHRIALGQKPALASGTVVPPFHLFADRVSAHVNIIHPFPEGGVLAGPLTVFPFKGEFADRPLAAIGAA